MRSKSLIIAIIIILSSSLFLYFQSNHWVTGRLSEICQSWATPPLYTACRNIDVKLPRVTVAELSATLLQRGVYLNLSLEAIELRLQLLSLLLRQPTLDFRAKLYRGHLNGRLRSRWRPGEGEFEANLVELELKEHPLLAGLGLKGGNLSARLQVTDLREREGLFELRLNDLKRHGPVLLPGIQLAQPLPDGEISQLTAKGQMIGDALVLEQGALQSSWGEAIFQGRLWVPPGSAAPQWEQAQWKQAQWKQAQWKQAQWELWGQARLTDRGRQELSQLTDLSEPLPARISFRLHGRASSGYTLDWHKAGP